MNKLIEHYPDGLQIFIYDAYVELSVPIGKCFQHQSLFKCISPSKGSVKTIYLFLHQYLHGIIWIFIHILLGQNSRLFMDLTWFFSNFYIDCSLFSQFYFHFIFYLYFDSWRIFRFNFEKKIMEKNTLKA